MFQARLVCIFFVWCIELVVTRLRLLKGTKEEESPRLNVYLTAKIGFGLNPFATDSSPMPPRIKSVAHRFPRTQQTHVLMRTTSIRTASMWHPETTTPATRSKYHREQSCRASLACAPHTCGAVGCACFPAAHRTPIRPQYAIIALYGMYHMFEITP